MGLNNNIFAKSLNHLTINACKDLLKHGIHQETRNGGAKALYDVNIRLQNPRARHLCLKGRTNNIFATLGEIFWVMAGDDRINPYLSFFIPRAKNYSDDGKTWYSAYGKRLWDYKQFEHVFDLFKNDGLYTRRATQSIFLPHTDTYAEYSKRTQGSIKDIACNQWINYFVIPSTDTTPNLLCMKVATRSNDCIFGLSNINVPEFTLIQEFVLQHLQAMYKDKVIEMGTYIQSITNLHIYDFTLKQGENIIQNLDENVELTKQSNDDNHKCVFPEKLNEVKEFFECLVENFSILIQDKRTQKNTEKIFEDFKLQKENNLLYAYALLVEKYILNKQGLQDNITLPKLPKGLENSIRFSSFRNFDFE